MKKDRKYIRLLGDKDKKIREIDKSECLMHFTNKQLM